MVDKILKTQSKQLLSEPVEYNEVSFNFAKLDFNHKTLQIDLLFYNDGKKIGNRQIGITFDTLTKFLKNGNPEENLLNDLIDAGLIPAGNIENKIKPPPEVP